MANKQGFEQVVNGKQTKIISVGNDKGLQATISNYGARIITLVFDGINVTPGYNSLEPYMSSAVAPYHGATVGRYANRIANGKFELNGKQYTLPVNNVPNHLHGGPNGFHNQVWLIISSKKNEITLSHFSDDGEEGYPGNLTVAVTYSLSDNNEFIISYTAKTDAATPFNITNHAFFNLNGDGSVLDHRLQINADRFTPVDSTLIPTGELKPVDGSAFDFRNMKRLGEHIENKEEQIRLGGGYDHNFVLNKTGDELSFAAKAIGDKTGIVMETFTTEPGMQFFSSNFEAVKGDPKTFRNTFCLETQHFPDSPNQPNFPYTIIEAGQTFTSKTIYKFSR